MAIAQRPDHQQSSRRGKAARRGTAGQTPRQPAPESRPPGPHTPSRRHRSKPSPTGSKIRTTRTRFRNMPVQSDLCWVSLCCGAIFDRRDAPITPLAVAVFLQRQAQLLFIKIRPINRREEPLGIGPLPDQEVAAAQLARSADDQVRIRHAGSEQVLVDLLCGDFFRPRSHP